MKERENALQGRFLALVLTAMIVTFVLIVFLPFFHGWRAILPAVGMTVIFTVIFLWRKKKNQVGKYARALLLLAVIMTMMASLFGFLFVRHEEREETSLADGNTHVVLAVISNVIYEKPYGAVYDISLTAVDGLKKHGYARLFLSGSEGFSVYDKLSFEGIFSRHDVANELYLKAKGIGLSVTAEDAMKTGEKKRDIRLFLRDIRSYIAGNFSRFIGEKEGAVATALFLGERDALDGQTKLAFRRLGISHLLAASGLHLSIVIGGADFLMRVLTVPKRKKSMILIVLIAVFAAICGFSSSILRASLMLSLFYFAEIIGERSDPMTSLLVAVTLILGIRPYSVYDGGLWLSFLSTFGIVLASPLLLDHMPSGKIKKRGKDVVLRMGKILLSGLFVSFVAFFFTAPVVYWLYGGVSILFPIANLIFIPAVRILMYLFMVITLFFFVPILPNMLGAVCRFFIAGILRLANIGSDLSGVYISIRYPFVCAIMIFFVFGLIWLLIKRRFWIKQVMSLFLICILAFGISLSVFRKLNEDDVHLYLQTDGKSDVVGLVSEGRAVLLDIATGGYTVPSRAADTLDSYYICEIDSYILTHLHAYHAGTLEKMLEKIKIHRILMPKAETDSEREATALILDAVSDSCEILYYDKNVRTEESWNGMKFCFEQTQYLKRSSHPIIRFSAEIFDGEHVVAYLGSGAMETDLAREMARDSSVLICGSHGPVMKNIIDTECFDGADGILFANRETTSFLEMQRIVKKSIFAEECDGLIRVCFEK